MNEIHTPFESPLYSAPLDTVKQKTERTAEIFPREQDLENPGLSPRGEGARLGIDATRKWKEENYSRERPDIITMDEKVMERVFEHWKSDGFE